MVKKEIMQNDINMYGLKNIDQLKALENEIKQYSDLMG